MGKLFCKPEEDRTVQSFAADADINNIVKRFGLTGMVQRPLTAPFNADFPEAMDFHSVMESCRLIS